MEENRTFESHEGFSLCVRVRERLQDLYEGYLDAMTAEAIRAHLNVCFMCNQEYRDLEQTVRLIETLPFVDPIRDYTPSVMAAIQRQSGYSFQAPVVEVEAERLASLPRSITKANKRRFWIFNFGFWKRRDYSVPSQSPGDLPVRERVVGVFALVAAFMALVLSSFGSSAYSIQGSALASDGSLVHAPVIGPLIAFFWTLISYTGASAGMLFGGLSRLPLLVASLGTALAVSLLYAVFARKQQLRGLAGR